MDFRKLASKYPRLSRYIYKRKSGVFGINFKDVDAVRELNIALFAEYHGLDLNIPVHHLCPSPDSRLSYVKWIELLCEPWSEMSVGLDIGTGICAIYPLLMCKRNEMLSFICTDIQKEAVESSKQNVVMNGMTDRIKVELVESDTIFPFDKLPDGLAFTMCNPPFYSDASDIDKSREIKHSEAQGKTAANSREMITEGGEFNFISQMFMASSRFEGVDGSDVWFTSLMGKKQTLADMQSFIKTSPIRQPDVRWTSFKNGRTTRYCIAWNFWKSNQL